MSRSSLIADAICTNKTQVRARVFAYVAVTNITLTLSVTSLSAVINNKKAVLSQRLPRDARYIVYREALRRYGNSKLSKMAAAAILNLLESKIAPLDPPSPKTPL